MDINLRALIGKFNQTTRTATEAAAGLCLSRTHYNVEVEHYLAKLLDSPGSDFGVIAKYSGVDTSRFSAELNRGLDRFKTGNGRTPALSPDFVETMMRAWTIASIDYASPEIRTGYTILALLSDDKLSRIMREVSKEFQKISPEDLRKNFLRIVRGSAEQTAAAAPEDDAAIGPGARAAGGKTPHLDQYTVNLTENAKSGKIDPVLGRDFEIRQIVDILTRRRQNNPILVGKLASVRPPLSKASPCGSVKATCRRFLRMLPSGRSISRSSRPAPASKESLRTASKASSTK